MNKSEYRAALALIEPVERWTTTGYARDKFGFGVQYSDPRAVKWCALGACLLVTRAGFAGSNGADIHELASAAMELYKSNVACVNDLEGHEAVKKIFARAIELAPEG